MFKQIYDQIVIQSIQLNRDYKIFKQLFTASEERITLLNNVAPGYFRVTQDLLIGSVFLSICRLTDPIKSAGKKNLSFDRLFSEISDKISKSKLTKLEKLLKGIKEKSQPIRDYRNKRLSHTDLEDALKLSSKIGPIPRNLVDELINDINNIFETLAADYEGAHYFTPDVSFQGDAEDLIFFLEKGIDASRNTKIC